jgi:hypothetical protein
MASAIYNLGLNFGEAIGPVFGGYITEKYDFKTSCIATGFIALAYSIFFFAINYQKILLQLEEGKNPHFLNQKDSSLATKINTTDSDYQGIIRHGGEKIQKEYVGRYRAYSYSNRSSKRSSFAVV